MFVSIIVFTNILAFKGKERRREERRKRQTQREKSKFKEKQNYLWLLASKELQILEHIGYLQSNFNYI